MQTQYLEMVIFRADNESMETLCEKIDEKVDSYANGDLDHAVDAMTLLWKLSKGDSSSVSVIDSDHDVTQDCVSQPSLTTNPSAHH